MTPARAFALRIAPALARHEARRNEINAAALRAYSDWQTMRATLRKGAERRGAQFVWFETVSLS